MSKIRKTIGWILTILVAGFLLFSASGKFMGANPDMQKMFNHLGLSVYNIKYIGILEVFCVIVFLIPRTAVFGTMLVTSYMGGAIATHITHGDSAMFQIVFTAIVWITAVIRLPELGSRISGKKMH